MDTENKNNNEQTQEVQTSEQSQQNNAPNNNATARTQNNSHNNSAGDFDLETYRQNLNQPTPEQSQVKELQDFIKEQNQAINNLRSEIESLKQVNLKLATTQSTVDKPQSAEDILSEVFFGKEK